jgi:cadmium resistance protein CadD (predicted permease)
MDDILLAVTVSFMAYASTSIDNLFLLVTLSLHPKYGVAKVRQGYLLAVLVMIGICLLFAQGIQQLPAEFIPYIGLVPLGLGMLELWQLIRRSKSKDITTPDIARGEGGSFLTIMLIMFTHSWDSIAVLAPLLSDTRPGLIGWMGASILTAAAILTFGAQKTVGHAKIRSLLERYAPKILPFLLIGVGLYILTNTPTDIT